MATDKDDQVTQTEQNILNKSQDTEFKVLAFEMLGHNSSTNVLERLKSTDGVLQTSVTISASSLATPAKQDTILTELQLKADLTETQPVSLASVPSHAVTNAGTFAVQETQATTIYNGKKVVTTATTRVTLASSQAVKSVTIKALVANTGTIYIGDGTVAAANGFALSAGDTISLDIANLATVNLDSSVSGEGVTYIAIG